jgi:hypothetical protein
MTKALVVLGTLALAILWAQVELYLKQRKNKR